MKTIMMIMAGAFLTGCVATATVSDIGDDHVKVQVNVTAKRPLADAKANAACALYGKRAKYMSYRCMDQYCMMKEVLYACLKG